jgi:hypothetical protein
LFGTIGITLYPEDKEAIINNLEKIYAIEFDKNSPLRIACSRFDRSLHDMDFEDKIIDLCIGFEALYLKGEYGQDKGQSIGLGCSMLLGLNNKERTKIYNNIKNAFKIRNDIIHGKSIKIKNLHIIVSNLEDYLRSSILRLIP